MPHLLGILFCIGIVWAFVAFPSFRIVAGIFVLAGIITVALLINGDNQATKLREKKAADEQVEAAQRRKVSEEREAKRWGAILLSEVELRDPVLKLSYGNNFDSTASVKNNSKLRISGMQVDITAFDCVVPNPANQPIDLTPRSLTSRPEPQREICEIVGRLDETFSADVPPSQVRGIEKRIVLSNLPRIAGRFAWQMRVIKVRGSDPSSTWMDELSEKYSSGLKW
jgi:hypothetical protein